MAPGVDGLEFLDADVGVDGGGFELGVSEELLDVADVRAAFEHVRGAGVAEQVRASCAVDVGLLDVAGHLAAEHFGIEAFAVAAEEEGGFVGLLREQGPAPGVSPCILTFTLCDVKMHVAVEGLTPNLT
jgi:hypothetical protein